MSFFHRFFFRLFYQTHSKKEKKKTFQTKKTHSQEMISYFPLSTIFKLEFSFKRFQNGWMEPRIRRILGNIKKSEERSQQILLCKGEGELCSMLFKTPIKSVATP